LRQNEVEIDYNMKEEDVLKKMIFDKIPDSYHIDKARINILMDVIKAMSKNFESLYQNKNSPLKKPENNLNSKTPKASYTFKGCYKDGKMRDLPKF